MKPTIAIAGASGFIGRWFIDTFNETYNIIALSRNEVYEEARANVAWRMADLYSLSSTESALKGADFALYLVHSMSPSTHLNQGTFEETDLLLADNFARSAEKCGLKQIIFVGGILPKDESKFSRHLRSRFEVEQTLGSRTTPLTTLRAGVIIGPGGSSFEIVEKLVKRLPIMACPKWTKSLSQPIDVDDVLKLISACLGNASTYNKAIEIGGEQVISYMDLLKMTAESMGKKRIIFSIPFFTLGFSKLWVGLFSDSNATLVSPLIESLRHDMTVGKNDIIPLIEYTNLKDSLLKAIRENPPKMPKGKMKSIQKNTVRSVQRLPNPGLKSAIWVAQAYPSWLSKKFRYLLKASENDNLVTFQLLGVKLLELRQIHDRSDTDRQLFFIVGGKLARSTDTGWLEFRSVLDNRYVISAIHQFIPSLPWTIYKYTQAIVHLLVMKSFGSYLSKQSGGIHIS